MMRTRSMSIGLRQMSMSASPELEEKKAVPSRKNSVGVGRKTTKRKILGQLCETVTEEADAKVAETVPNKRKRSNRKPMEATKRAVPKVEFIDLSNDTAAKPSDKVRRGPVLSIQRGGGPKPLTAAAVEFEKIAPRLFVGRVAELNALQHTDVLISPCMDNIFTGANRQYFEQLTHIAGKDQLGLGLLRFHGMAAGAVGFMSVARGSISSFKSLGVFLLPPTLEGNSAYDCYLGYRNSLDIAVEEEHTSVTFLHPSKLSGADEGLLVRTAICAISEWFNESPYREKIKRVSIACSTDEASKLYKRTHSQIIKRARPSDAHHDLCPYLVSSTKKKGKNDSTTREGGPVNREEFSIDCLEEILQEEIRRYIASNGIQQQHDEQLEGLKEDVEEWRRLLKDPEKVERMEHQLFEHLFYTDGQVELQLSKHLHQNVLLIESLDSDSAYAFNGPTRSKWASGSYKCGGCNSAYQRAGNWHTMAAVWVGEDGTVTYLEGKDTHHDQCVPIKKADIIIQQLHRRVRLHESVNNKPIQPKRERVVCLDDDSGEEKKDASDDKDYVEILD